MSFGPTKRARPPRERNVLGEKRKGELSMGRGPRGFEKSVELGTARTSHFLGGGTRSVISRTKKKNQREKRRTEGANGGKGGRT